MGRDRRPNVVILECFVCRWKGDEAGKVGGQYGGKVGKVGG